MRLRKKIAVVGVATALVASVVLIAPAQAVSKDLVVGITLDIDKLDPQAATSFCNSARTWSCLWQFGGSWAKTRYSPRSGNLVGI